MNITATITDIQKKDTEVTIIVQCMDGAKLNQSTTFTLALSPTMDDDINQVITGICANLAPAEVTTPVINVAIQVGQIFDFDSTTGIATAQSILATPPMQGGVS